MTYFKPKDLIREIKLSEGIAAHMFSTVGVKNEYEDPFMYITTKSYEDGDISIFIGMT